MFITQIYKLGMYGKEYVWMIPGNFPEAWWREDYGEDCTQEQLRAASEGYLSIAFTFHSVAEVVGISGRVSADRNDGHLR